MDYFLGLDGGGTKTAAVILDSSRTELGRGSGGPCNIATCADEALRESVQNAVAAALDSTGLPHATRFTGVCAGVAGFTAKRRRADFARILQELVPADSYRVEPDYVIAYWGATEGAPGIVVIAGTGSVVYGRNVRGESCRIGGHGYLLGDMGGFELGRLAILGLVDAQSEGLALDDFDNEILAASGLNDPDDLVEWVYRHFDAAKIASLAFVVGAAADRGVFHARMDVEHLALSLGSRVYAALKRLRMKVSSTPIYMIGSLWNIRRLRERFIKDGLPGVRQPRMNACEPKQDAAFGAALLAISQSLPSLVQHNHAVA